MDEKIIIGQTREPPPPPRKPPSWFWWTLVNVTVLCLAVLTWAACLYVFNQPEKPENHRILERISRPPELNAFTALDAPAGALADPRSLYRKFLALDDPQRALLNPRLLRNYLTNFEQTLLNTYIEGEFRIREVRTLTGKDLFHPGIAVRAQAEVNNEKSRRPATYPVWIDFLFPTSDSGASGQFTPGGRLVVKKIPNCVAVLRVDRFLLEEDPQILLTAIPIAYGDYTDEDKRHFPVAPPARVRPDAPLPVFPPPEG